MITNISAASDSIKVADVIIAKKGDFAVMIFHFLKHGFLASRALDSPYFSLVPSGCSFSVYLWLPFH